jgi:hypothetical protein
LQISENYFSGFELLKSVSPINTTAIFLNLVAGYPMRVKAAKKIIPI